jgi:iron(III) transport system permease protein
MQEQLPGCTGCGFADNGPWGRLSALGIIMIFISTTLVLLATLVGAKLRAVEA